MKAPGSRLRDLEEASEEWRFLVGPLLEPRGHCIWHWQSPSLYAHRSRINLPAAQAAVTGATLYTTNGFVLLDVPNHPVHHCASNDAAMSTRPTRWTGAAETRVPFPRFAPLPAGMGAAAPHDTFHHRGRALGFEADTAGIFTADFHPDSLWMRATVVHQ